MTKYIAGGCSVILALCGVSVGNPPRPVNAPVTRAIVYRDRARVYRRGSVSLSGGQHRLEFRNLPAATDQQSVTFSGKGFTLIDLRVERLHSTEFSDPAIARLQSRLTVLDDSVSLSGDARTRIKNEKALVQAIVDKLTSESNAENEAPPVLEPEKWIKMVSFYRRRTAELDTEKRTVDAVLRELKEEQKKVRQELAELQKTRSKTAYRAMATCDVPKTGTITAVLAYTVHGPSWRPVYELRVNADDPENLALVYKAEVRQNTGEPWEGIALALSTAEPHLAGQPPELQPWYLDFKRPVRHQHASRARLMKAQAAPARGKVFLSEESEMATDMLEEPMQVRQATVQQGTAAMSFEPSGATTIQGDNQPYTVVLTKSTLPARMTYSSVPRLAPHVYLKAEAENTGAFAFLPGKSAIFLDNTFVANGALALVAPGESFAAFLGVDNAVEVTYTLVKRYEKKTTALTRKRELVYEYEMEFKNNKSHAVDLTVEDQVPVSRNEEISVTLIDPDPDKAKITLTNLGYLTLQKRLDPHKKFTQMLIFSITFPSEREVEGL